MLYCEKSNLDVLIHETTLRRHLEEEHHITLPQVELTDEILAPFNYACVPAVAAPEGMWPSETQQWNARAVYNTVTQSYERVMFLEPVPPEKIAERRARIEKGVRQERDQLLLESDWVVLRAWEAEADATMWQIYRQALRDIPQQPGFPFKVDYPQKPAE